MATDSSKDESDDAAAKAFDFEREKWEVSRETDVRDYNLRVREQDFMEGEARRSRFTNPLLIAIVGGLLAAVVNIYSTLTSTANQQGIELNKLSQERQLATKRSEEERIYDAIKLADCNQIKERLKALDSIGLISDDNRRANINRYVGTLTCVQAPSPQPAPPSPPFELSSGWLSGGHNQGEQCQAMRPQAVARYPNRPIIQLSSREESKKDWLGHVEYMYFCTFQAQ